MTSYIFTSPGDCLDDEIFAEQNWLKTAKSNIDFKVNISESKDCYLVMAEVPGLGREEIKYEFVGIGNTLIISGNFKEEEYLRDDRHHLRERRFGKFERIFTLPKDADRKSVTDEHKNGVLTLKINKTPSTHGLTQVLPPVPIIRHEEPVLEPQNDVPQTDSKVEPKVEQSGESKGTEINVE